MIVLFDDTILNLDKVNHIEQDLKKCEITVHFENREKITFSYDEEYKTHQSLVDLYYMIQSTWKDINNEK